MKTLKMFLLATAFLMFSGCYTQLMVEEDATWDPGPIYIPPTITIYYPPDPDLNPQPPRQPHRDSGYQRDGSSTNQQNSQDNSRSMGATRSDGRTGSTQSSQSDSQVSVPTRGNEGSQATTPQRGSQDNSTTSRRR